MERRTFLSSAFGTTLMAAAGGSATGQAPGTNQAAAPEFYVWRQFIIRNGTQPRRLADFLQNAAIPALNRLGHKPVGVFEVVAGVPAPTVFVLTPSASLDKIAAVEPGLERDAEFMKSAASYLDAPASDPVYVRQEVSLLAAFPNVPRIEIPAATATNGPRLFELRTYESHNERAHRMKTRMFTEMGEVDIFRRVGLTPVFFSRTSRPAYAEPGLHAGPRKPGGTRQELECLPQRSRVEEAGGDRRLQRRGDRHEHHYGPPAAGGLLTGLGRNLYPTCIRGRRNGSGSAWRSTSRVTGAVSPSPNARNFSR